MRVTVIGTGYVGLVTGACLADDMGLGKTLQVLALLLRRRNEIARDSHSPQARRASAPGTSCRPAPRHHSRWKRQRRHCRMPS